MTPSDDFWRELSRIEPRYGDLFWEGTIDVGESPGWCEELARLIRVAQQPATPDELASEEATVAAMAEARGTARVRLERSPAQSLGRVAVVKGAVLFGVLAGGVAAAASTGIAGDVVPGWSEPPAPQVETPPTTIADIVEEPVTETGAEERPSTSGEDGSPAVVVDEVLPAGEDTPVPGPVGEAEVVPESGEVPESGDGPGHAYGQDKEHPSSAGRYDGFPHGHRSGDDEL
ncbi:MAG TPA: hypothetical protein VGJ86_05880 [Acidimicrobiales bacterium]|jgi:hypothetical protein